MLDHQPMTDCLCRSRMFVRYFIAGSLCRLPNPMACRTTYKTNPATNHECSIIHLRQSTSSGARHSLSSDGKAAFHLPLRSSVYLRCSCVAPACGALFACTQHNGAGVFTIC